MRSLEKSERFTKISEGLEEAYREGQISEEIYRGFKSGPDPRDPSGAAKSTAGGDGQIDRRINEELGKESPTQPTVA